MITCQLEPRIRSVAGGDDDSLDRIPSDGHEVEELRTLRGTGPLEQAHGAIHGRIVEQIVPSNTPSGRGCLDHPPPCWNGGQTADNQGGRT